MPTVTTAQGVPVQVRNARVVPQRMINSIVSNFSSTSSELDELRNAVLADGFPPERMHEIVQLIIDTLIRSRETVIPSSTLKKVRRRPCRSPACSPSPSALASRARARAVTHSCAAPAVARRRAQTLARITGVPVKSMAVHVRTVLNAIETSVHGFDRANNHYFALGPRGRLDATHLNDVLIKPDGVHEILNQAQLPGFTLALRRFTRAVLVAAMQEVSRLRGYETDALREEAERVQAGRSFMGALNALGLNHNQAKGHLRLLDKRTYEAMGFVDRSVPGFKSATSALQQVASVEQLAARPSMSFVVADNLVIIGKKTMTLTRELVARDVARAAPAIMAAGSEEERDKRMREACSIRVKRHKRFNVHDPDPTLIGVDMEAPGAPTIDPRERAAIFLDQTRDMINYQPYRDEE